MKRASLIEQLFGEGAVETAGMRLQARLYEGFLLCWTVMCCWRWADEMRRFQLVIKPHGIARYLDLHFLFGPAAFWNAALVSAGALLGASRVAPRLGYTLALAGFHLQFVARYSQGKMCHDTTFVGIGVLVLCCAMWLFRSAADRRSFLVGASLFMFGLGYLTAAASKLIKSGLHWVDGEHLWLWIGEKSVDALATRGTLELSWLQQKVLEHHALATLILTVGLVTELCGGLLWFRRTRPYVALACIGLHVGIYLTMDILFDANIYLLALVALPWAQLVDALASADRAPQVAAAS